MNDAILNKYQIIKKFKEGGMSQVFLARHKSLDDLRIIKIISKKETPDLMLMTEPNILKAANHPSIPRIYDIEQSHDKLYIVKEYIEGTTLNALIEEQGALDEITAKSIMLKLSKAIRYLHSMKPAPIIHKDIKPDNIIITCDNIPVIIDFGISRTYKETSTSDTFMYGSPMYTAPEVFSEIQSDVRSDIYSLGLTYYYMLTSFQLNTPPFEVMPPRLINDKISKCSDEIVMKSTKRDPEKRFSSIDEIISLLEEKIKKNISRKKLILIICLLITAFFAFTLIRVFSNQKLDQSVLYPDDTHINFSSNFYSEDSLSHPENFTIIYNGTNTLEISEMDSLYENDTWYVNYDQLDGSMFTFNVGGNFYEFNNDVVRISIPIIPYEYSALIMNSREDFKVAIDCDKYIIFESDKMYIPIEYILTNINNYEYLNDGRVLKIDHVEDINVLCERYGEEMVFPNE